jgi:hypothetical protein
MRKQPSDPLIGSRSVRRRLVSIEAAAIAGIVCALGWSLSLRGLLAAPGIGASDAEVLEYYSHRSNGTTALVWLQVLVIATIAFLWFVGVVRNRIGDREPRLFGTVFFGSSILLSTLVFVGTALLAAPSMLLVVSDETPDADAVALTRASAAIVLSVFLPRIATLLMFSTAGLARATGAFPKWLVWLTYIIGACSFVNVSIATPSVYVVPAWIALVSIVLLVRRPPQGFELEAPRT